MSSSNEYGQGKSHATGDSAVPGKVQEAAPSGLEEALPDKVRFVIEFPAVQSLTAVSGPPYRRQGRPVHLADTRQGRR